MQLALNLAIGILPILLLCGFAYLRDARRPEKPQHLLITFGLGIVFGVIAYFLESQIDALGYQNATTLLPYTLYVFLGVALVEEVLKYVPVLVYPFQRSFFDEPLDGMVYCVYAAMGFALVETIVYAPIIDWSGMVTRATLAVPGHAAFAMIAGYFLGRARIQASAGPRNRYILLGLLWAVVAHGLYDFFIFNPFTDGIRVVAVFVLLTTWVVATKLTKEHAEGPEPTPIAAGRAA